MLSLTTALAGLLGASSLVAAAGCPAANASLVAHTGTPVGKEEVHDGINMYITKPEGLTGNATNAVLYLTDVFGIQLAQTKLLADSFARAGFLTVAPDLFNGTPAPGDINVPGFNTTAFLAAHGPNQTDPILARTIAYLRGTLGVRRIGAVGYCFGGRYSFRSAGPAFVVVGANGGAGAGGGGVDAVFAAHPSLLGDDEIAAVRGPASVAAAEADGLMPPERRAQVEALLQKTGLAYSLALYGGTSHGFGVRANVSDPRQKFAKEEAFLQAVRWFEAWL